VPNLSLVVCGAPLASRTKDLRAALEAAGWTVTVAPTVAAEKWLGDDFEPSTFRSTSDPKPARPDAVVVAPMTLNTATKWAHGHADSQPLSLLCEALGARKQAVAVPFVNEFLWAHPAFPGALEALAQAGVRLIDPAGGATPRALSSGTGDEIARQFDPAWVVGALGS
jgi:hypothetical protein